MILTSAQQKAFEKALAAVAATLPKLVFLERMAEGDPVLMERVEPLRSLVDFLTTQSTLALELATAEAGGGDDE